MSGISNLYKESSVFKVYLSFTKQVNYKVSRKSSENLCAYDIAEQSDWSKKISLAITRQITQELRHKFITHKNNCCQVFSRSRNDLPLFVNEYKVGWQSSSLKKKILDFAEQTTFQWVQTILHNFLWTCEYFNFRWTFKTLLPLLLLSFHWSLTNK